MKPSIAINLLDSLGWQQMIQEVVFMLERDAELFIEHCELKGLSKKTIGNYEQTMRLDYLLDFPTNRGSCRRRR